MSRIKTANLTGAALDWAVAKCEGYASGCGGVVPYSTDWSQGGPIIERKRICLDIGHDGVWLACIKQNYEDKPEFLQAGQTSLVAAMRCYVASKLGSYVDVPEELV